MKVKKTILCVDDHEQSLSIRKLLLETRGYRVIACTGGEQALAAFSGGRVDLVLTDLIMPGMSGNDLVERIKQLSPDTPVILFSGRTAGANPLAPGSQARAQARHSGGIDRVETRLVFPPRCLAHTGPRQTLWR